jgi:hypothetical protein
MNESPLRERNFMEEDTLAGVVFEVDGFVVQVLIQEDQPHASSSLINCQIPSTEIE